MSGLRLPVETIGRCSGGDVALKYSCHHSSLICYFNPSAISKHYIKNKRHSTFLLQTLILSRNQYIAAFLPFEPTWMHRSAPTGIRRSTPVRPSYKRQVPISAPRPLEVLFGMSPMASQSHFGTRLQSSGIKRLPRGLKAP